MGRPRKVIPQVLPSRTDKIIVRAAAMIAYDCVEIKGTIGSKFARRYTVHFGRRGDIRYAYQELPEIGWTDPKNIPPTVKEAAHKCYVENRDKWMVVVIGGVHQIRMET